MEDKDDKKTIRPPVVVVMGHVDHGKTKILDWYRKTKVVEQESGGITQHIGAYEVNHHGKKITFIDTPGHEAFSKMRSRGAKVADIAILVVAADEGVKLQTKEAIKIIKENNLPFVVAINKIDKAESQPDRIKGDLAEEEVMVESYGGKVPSVEISAKNGERMDDLLEVVLLMAEIENLQTAGDVPGKGVVIEAHLDQRRGITATILLQEGNIRQGNFAVVGRSLENIKILENFLGKSIAASGPSSPVRIVGLVKNPAVGEEFRIFETKDDATKYIDTLPPDEETRPPKNPQSDGEKIVFNLIMKTDTVGSREVFEESLGKIQSDAIAINILRSDIGNIAETDIKLALATKLVTVAGFKVKVDASARDLADRGNIRIVLGEVIYEVLDALKKHIEEMIPPHVLRTNLGKIKILKVFKKEGSIQVIGGRVEDGLVRTGTRADIKRMKETIGNGTIQQLQVGKNIITEVLKGAECGIQLESKTVISENDLLEIYSEEIKKRTL